MGTVVKKAGTNETYSERSNEHNTNPEQVERCIMYKNSTEAGKIETIFGRFQCVRE